VTRSRASRRPLWLIAKRDDGRMDVLTLSPEENGEEEEALPVFSYEEEAEAFLRLQEPGNSWRARETTVEELVSLLYRHCKSIEKVVLDPLPVAVDSRVVVDLTGPGRENFLRNFLAVDRSSLANQVKWVRQNEGERGGTENESAFDGSSKNPDDLYIPDYAMRDFGSADGSCNGSDRRNSVLEVPGEDLVPRRE
jgi:hypothetical protein